MDVEDFLEEYVKYVVRFIFALVSAAVAVALATGNIDVTPLVNAILEPLKHMHWPNSQATPSP